MKRFSEGLGCCPFRLHIENLISIKSEAGATRVTKLVAGKVSWKSVRLITTVSVNLLRQWLLTFFGDKFDEVFFLGKTHLHYQII